MTAKRSRGEAEEGETIKTANLLMLLSQVGESTNSIITVPSDRVFKCKTCNKQFHTFQALGGHRASHKKIKLVAELLTQPSNSRRKAKKHECPICGLEFAMGQALGGHMRRHRAAILEETKGLEIDNKSQPQNMAPAVFLKRSNSSKRVFGLDLNLNLLPYENDLEQRIKTPTPLLNCFM